MDGSRPGSRRRAWILLWIFAAATYSLTAPGRITFPDDEIVFQTTESIARHGSLAIEGISKRSGEPADRPTGTFGWGPGRGTRPDGGAARYGFFGHALAIAALPMHSLGRASASWVPSVWTRAARGDLVVFHTRSHEADWTRLVVSFTNALITPIAVVIFGAWLTVLGFRRRTAVATAIAYALCTSAWPYTSTFLSEPLSAAILLASAWGIARWHRGGPARDLWFAGAMAGLAVHAHLLNFTALPALLLYAWGAGRTRAPGADDRAAWIGGFALAVGGVALLGLDQALRFGSPFESGRFGHYGHFVAPWEGLAAMLLAPGRSLFVYSPAILLAGLGLRDFVRRAPAAAAAIAAIVALRWLTAATRSDWYGGWGLGPRYLVPILPFALAPLACVIERAAASTRARRLALRAALIACALYEGYLAAHSIFEWMFELARRFGTADYFARSHWSPAAMPIVGFAGYDLRAIELAAAGRWQAAFGGLRLDSLSFGALRLAKAGHPGLVGIFALLALVAVAAGLALRRSIASTGDGERPDD